MSPASLPEFFLVLPQSFPTSFAPRIASQQPYNIRHIVGSMQKGTLTAANPIAKRVVLISPQSRQLSTTSFLRSQQRATPLTKIFGVQKRTIFGASMSRNLLAHVEETATRNPNSATAQNAFYQALLRANMPAIIVERYQTNQFATNSAT